MPLDLKSVATSDEPRDVRMKVSFVSEPGAQVPACFFKVCIAAAEPVYRLLGSADRLQAVYPAEEHDLSTAARHQACEFRDRLSMPSS